MADRQKRRYGTVGCEVEGCERPHCARGMCKAHYRALREHGTPTPRRRAEAVNGKRICPRCKVDRPLSEWGAAGCCKACNRANAKKYQVLVTPTPTACVVCGDEFPATRRQRFTCSEGCRRKHKARRDSGHQKANRESAREANRRWRRANLEKLAEKQRRREARKRCAEVGPIDLDALWTGSCGICGEALDRDLRYPDPMSRSLDHIRALANGGSHTQSNLQWSHLICNVRKGANLVGEVA